MHKHNYLPDLDAVKDPKKTKFYRPCKICGQSKGGRCHIVENVEESGTVLKCPTCKGTGTLHLSAEVIARAVALATHEG